MRHPGWFESMTVAAVFVVACGFAGAQGHQAKLRQADADGDGKVTLEEAKAVKPDLTEEMFERFDRNGDGGLSRDDRPEGRAGQRGEGRPAHKLLEAAKRADADEDGKVTYDELKAVAPNVPKQVFDRADADGDGVLTAEDEKAMRARGPRGGGGPDLARMIEMAKGADADGNGEVTKEELSAAAPNLPPQAFARLDANKDGVLTMADVELLNAAPARPQGPPHAPKAGGMDVERLIETAVGADADGNEEVTKEELSAAAPNLPPQAFARLDANGDGVLTIGDVEALRARMAQPAVPEPLETAPVSVDFKEADKDGDGKLTYGEAWASVADMTKPYFDSLDKDGDGFVSSEELSGGKLVDASGGSKSATAKRGSPEARGQRAGKNANPGGRRNKPAAQTGAQRQVFDAADANSDGKVTFVEAQAVAPQITQDYFNTLDANGDGGVTYGEYAKSTRGGSAQGEGRHGAV